MKIRHLRGLASGIAAASALAVVSAGWAWPQTHDPAPVTKSLQEHPLAAEDQRLHAFYDLLVEARGQGLEKVDAGLEMKARNMARQLPPGHGLDAKAWEDHVVDMTGQMLVISKKDPRVLQSYDNFVVALRGPQ